MPPEARLPSPAVFALILLLSTLPVSLATKAPKYLNGVNLGGWLVLEPWMSRSSPLTNSVPASYRTESSIADYWSTQGKAEQLFAQHRSSFITPTILDALQSKKVNFLRLPLGFWATSTTPPFPYVGGILPYVDWLFNEAYKRKMKVVLDMHAAYGSQNGFDHSSPEVPRQADFCTNTTNQEMTLERIQEWTARYKDHKAFWGIAVLNEPTCNRTVLDSFYERAYNNIRSQAPNAWVVISPHVYAVDGDVANKSDWRAQELIFWSKWNRPAWKPQRKYLALDLHHLQTSWSVGTDRWYSWTVADHIRNINTDLRRRLQNYLKLRGTPLYIGEWSAAGPQYSWGSRWLAGQEIQQYVEAQRKVYSLPGIIGNSFWSARVDNSPVWSYLSYDSYGGSASQYSH